MWLDDIKLRNFWEYSVLSDTEVEVPFLVESTSRNTTKVTNSRKNNGNKFFEKIIHTISSESYCHTDRHTFTELEVRNSYTCMIDSWKLSRNKGKIILETWKIFISRGNICTNTHVEDYLFDMRNLHSVIYTELLRKCWKNFFDVLFFESHRRELRAYYRVNNTMRFFREYFQISLRTELFSHFRFCIRYALALLILDREASHWKNWLVFQKWLSVQE